MSNPALRTNFGSDRITPDDLREAWHVLDAALMPHADSPITQLLWAAEEIERMDLLLDSAPKWSSDDVSVDEVLVFLNEWNDWCKKVAGE